VKDFLRARVIFNHETFGTWKMTPDASDNTSCKSVTFLQMFNDIGALSLRLRSKDGHKWMSSINCLGSNNFVARIPHISRMWDDIIVELFKDIIVELKLREETTMTSVADLALSSLLVHHRPDLHVLSEPEIDGQEEAIEELVEFDVIKDQV
jgi:hypothetical protein